MQSHIEAISAMVDGMEPMLQQRLARLDQQYRQSPADVDLIWSLAETYRKLGRLDQALGGYQRVLALQPGHVDAQWLQAVLTGQDKLLLQRGDGCYAASFYLQEDFLNADQQARLWQVLQNNHSQFNATQTLDEDGKGKQDDYRSSSLLALKHVKRIQRWFMPMITARLPEICRCLGVQTFEPSRIECQLTKSQGGDYYKIHCDRGLVGKTATRSLTFVYYFHGEPKGFSGGDLLLFDGDDSSNTFNAHFTRIEPRNNRLICFDSRMYHAVLPVQSELKDWRFARFTLNGWLHSVA